MTDTSDSTLRIEAAWREHRSHLLNVAFRMLGNMSDAEDIVQDAFGRIARFDLDAIEDIKGWLIVVVSRLCLDHLGSSRVRREVQHEHDSTVFATPAHTANPADRVTLDDSVRLGLSVVIRQLSPAERTAFVLHDVFQYPFATIAEIVGRTPDSCRQLASRARRRIRSHNTQPTRFDIGRFDEDRIVEAFVGACAHGDIETLTELLDPDVVGDVDLGRQGTRGPVIGRTDVLANVLRFFGGSSDTTLVPDEINGQPGALAFRRRELVGLLELTTNLGRIVHIHATTDPNLVATVRSTFDLQ